MIAALGLTGIAVARDGSGGRRDAWILGRGLALGYAAAVVVNSIRILGAIGLASADLTGGWWTAARIHRLEGITVYFAGLLLLDPQVRRRAAGPRDSPATEAGS